jgi:signal transduction histidine kinase
MNDDTATFLGREQRRLGAVTSIARASVRLLQGMARLAARPTLFQRFALLSLAILLIGAYMIGSYVSREIEERVLHRTSGVTALYVDSFVSPHLQQLAYTHNPSEEHLDELDRLLGSTAMGDEILAFKIWHTDGEIVYASEKNLIGQGFPIGDDLAEALGGDIHTSVSNLDDPENLYERARWGRLIETYAPVRNERTGDIIGATEFYQDPGPLESEISESQRNGWLIVGGSTFAMYVLLVGLVGGASRTISRQHGRLQLLAQANAALASRVRKAAAQKTETDEKLLRRVAQDLHDGPVQDISLALLRLDAALAEAAEPESDTGITHTALSSALKEIRDISAGLLLPDMEDLSLGDVIRKAALEHEHKSGSKTQVILCDGLPDGGQPTKIAVYRVLQEALNNAFLHGQATREQVRVNIEDTTLSIEITDNGRGLSAGQRHRDRDREHLGIKGMKERIEMLGGTLEVTDRLEGGTSVRARIPLQEPGAAE